MIEEKKKQNRYTEKNNSQTEMIENLIKSPY